MNLEGANTRNFEDCEGSFLELKAIMFKSHYVGWQLTIVLVSRFYSLLDFLDSCSSTST